MRKFYCSCAHDQGFKVILAGYPKTIITKIKPSNCGNPRWRRNPPSPELDTSCETPKLIDSHEVPKARTFCASLTMKCKMTGLLDCHCNSLPCLAENS